MEATDRRKLLDTGRMQSSLRSVIRVSAKCVLLSVGMIGVGPGCKEPYRVGEHVFVEYDEGTYPAFIKEKRGTTKLVVHFEGCDSVWIREVSLDRIKGRISSEGARAPKQRRYVCTPKEPSPEQKAASGAYKVGDRVRVRWRGSNYPATIVGIVASDQYLIHYDGHESAWDETVDLERIAGRR